MGSQSNAWLRPLQPLIFNFSAGLSQPIVILPPKSPDLHPLACLHCRIKPQSERQGTDSKFLVFREIERERETKRLSVVKKVSGF